MFLLGKVSVISGVEEQWSRTDEQRLLHYSSTPLQLSYKTACVPPLSVELTTSTSTRVPAGLSRFAQRPVAALAVPTLITVPLSSAVPGPFSSGPIMSPTSSVVLTQSNSNTPVVATRIGCVSPLREACIATPAKPS